MMPGHNSNAANQLCALVERIERLDEEAKALNDDRKEVYGEAKASGFDTKVLKKIVADRRRDTAERQEFDAIYETYARALGMIPDFEDEPKTGMDVATRARPQGNPADAPAAAPKEITEEPLLDKDSGAAAASEEISRDPDFDEVPDHDSETGEITDQPTANPFEGDDGHPYASEPAKPDESERSSDEVNTEAEPAVLLRTGGEGLQENAVNPQDGNEPVSGEAAPVAPPPAPVETFDDPVAVILRLRPHCQNPTNCASYGRRHCQTCQVAAASAGLVE